jgi:hypothetical protein
MFSRIADFLQDQQGAPTARPLDEDDYISFDEAVQQRKPPRGIADIKKELTQRNFMRMYALRKDFRWLQKQMKKMGLNPEDARWIL